MTSIMRLVMGIFVSCIAMAAKAQIHQLTQGWNLLGNDTGQPITTSIIFGAPSNPTAAGAMVTSIWVWDTTTSRWKFFAPSLTNDELTSYAASRGYAVLSQIPAGAGFWINAPLSASLNLTNTVFATGFPITFKGIRMESLTYATDSSGHCRASLTFTNTTTASVQPFLEFDVIVAGVTVRSALFYYATLAGTTAIDTSPIWDSANNYMACGTFTLRFNDASSSVY